MTSIGDLLGNRADTLARNSISIGDVHYLSLGAEEGITAKNGLPTKDKYFVVLGFDNKGNIIGGIVVNSHINKNLPSSITDYMLPVTVDQCPFLKYNSFANCSRLKTVAIEKFNVCTYRGRIEDDSLLELIKGALVESPYNNKQQLREFGLME